MAPTPRAPAGSPAQKAAVLGLLAAAAVAISAAENALPAAPFLPPGAKLGLSNLVTTYAVIAFPFPYALFIAAAKACFALFTRGVTACAMSLAGGVLSACGMRLALCTRLFGLLGLGALGGALHNLAQLLVAFALIGGAAVYYLPALLLCGAAAGCAVAYLLYLLLPALSRCFSPAYPSTRQEEPSLE